MSCGNSPSNRISTLNEDAGPTINMPIYLVLADKYMLENHKTAIFKALEEWSVKTNYTLVYDLDFVDMSKQTKELDSIHTIKIFIKDPGPDYLGWTSWSREKMSANIYVEPAIDENLFRKVMLHELGHAFDLRFNGDSHYSGPYKSVMHSSVGSEQLECPELTAFCNNYNCQVDCTNVTE